MLTFTAVSGEMTILATIEATFRSVTSEISSWSSVISASESVVTVISSSEPSTVSVSVSASGSAEVFARSAFGELDFYLFAVDRFSVHAKLLTYLGKIEKCWNEKELFQQNVMMSYASMASSACSAVWYSMKAKEKVSLGLRLKLSMVPYFSNYLRRSSSVNWINKIFYSNAQVRNIDFRVFVGISTIGLHCCLVNN